MITGKAALIILIGILLPTTGQANERPAVGLAACSDVLAKAGATFDGDTLRLPHGVAARDFFYGQRVATDRLTAAGDLAVPTVSAPLAHDGFAYSQSAVEPAANSPCPLSVNRAGRLLVPGSVTAGNFFYE